MPKENKKRGRRAENKRKLETEQGEESSKRPRYDQDEEEQQQYEQTFNDNSDFIPFEDDGGQPRRPNEIPFYGVLDEQESEYFHKAGEMLEVNRFSGPDDREDFVRSVYDQAEGKELKMAFSQGTSRVLERLILLSNTAQLKQLFKAFTGNFMYLAQHRFSSHCCETLFAKAAPIVTQELASKFEGTSDEPSTEELFLRAASEMEEHFAYLMTNTFATHPLRILILVLGGKPIDLAAGKSGLHSRKKEKVTVMGGDRNLDPTLQEERVVPASFRKAVERFIEQAVSGQDATNNLQSLSTHPTCNPTLQLLIRLEIGQYGKQYSMILKSLIPDDPLTAESLSASFITNLLFDPVGSRLLEAILEVGPAKTFKSIYKYFLNDRIATLAKSDTASYVLCTALNRLGKDDIMHAIDVLSPEISILVERNKLNVIKTLYERAVARNVSTNSIENALEMTFVASMPDSKEPQATLDMTRMLHLSLRTPEHGQSDQTEGQSSSAVRAQHAIGHHASALVSTLLSSSTSLATSILYSMAALPSQLFHSLATSTSSASALTSALTSPAATPPLRRKLIARLYGQFGSSVALSPAGASVLLDGVWPGTRGIAFVRERVAEELAENESSLRASVCGRRVWRGWGMDAFGRRRREWEKWSRSEGGSEGGFVGFPERGVFPYQQQYGQHGGDDSRQKEHDKQSEAKSPAKKKERHMSALERARERHMRDKARREEKEQSTATVVEAV